MNNGLRPNEGTDHEQERKFREAGDRIACELFDSLDSAQECKCQHCETKVLKRALDAYVLSLSNLAPAPVV